MPLLHRLSYRTKITLAFSLLAFLGVFLVSGLFLYTGHQELRANRLATGLRMAGCLASNISRDVAADDLFASLTPRELAIARQVADGHSNKVIAIDSGISERTVKAHLNAIFRKTGIRNRVQLALAMAAEADPPRHRSTA